MLQPLGAQAAEGTAAAALPPELLAKVENPLCTRLLPQEGQTTSTSADMLRTNLSKHSPHSWHRYS